MGGGGGHPPLGSEMGKGGIAADAADAREEEFKAPSLPSLSFCARSCNRTVSEGGREEALPMRRILAVSKAPSPLMRHRKSDGRAPHPIYCTPLSSFSLSHSYSILSHSTRDDDDDDNFLPAYPSWRATQ